MDAFDEGRLKGLSLVVAQAIAAIAKFDDSPTAWLSSLEQGLGRAVITAGPHGPAADEAVRGVRQQVADVLELARQLIGASDDELAVPGLRPTPDPAAPPG